MYARLIDGKPVATTIAEVIEEMGGTANVSLPSPLTEEAIANLGLVPVAEGDRPAKTHTHIPEFRGLALADGQVVRQWRSVPRPLNAAKMAKWGDTKSARDRELNAGVDVKGIGTFQSDEASRINIIGAVVMAQIALANSQPFSVTWTLADNSVVELDAAKMIAVGAAVFQHVAGVHMAAQTTRAAIETARSIDELASVDVEVKP